MQYARDKDWLDVSVASSRLGISAQTLRNWQKEGKLSGKVRIMRTPSGFVRYHEQDLENFANGMVTR